MQCKARVFPNKKKKKIRASITIFLLGRHIMKEFWKEKWIQEMWNSYLIRSRSGWKFVFLNFLIKETHTRDPERERLLLGLLSVFGSTLLIRFGYSGSHETTSFLSAKSPKPKPIILQSFMLKLGLWAGAWKPRHLWKSDLDASLPLVSSTTTKTTHSDQRSLSAISDLNDIVSDPAIHHVFYLQWRWNCSLLRLSRRRCRSRFLL